MTESETTARPHVLVIDDEPNIRDLVQAALRFHGFEVSTAGSGEEGLALARSERPDLILLDVLLPDISGFDVCRRLRDEDDDVPVIYLTARDTPSDTVTGLSLGGDDYVTKPFSLDEIVARIKAILRRTMNDEEDAIIRAGELTMDQDTHEVTIGDAQIELSPTEFKLLRYLMLNPNRVLSKAQILDHVWEYDFNGDAGIVESYISYLRRKLDQFSSEPLIQTKRGFGYMLKAGKA
jgi:two-component system OmpR family response regulator